MKDALIWIGLALGWIGGMLLLALMAKACGISFPPEREEPQE